MNIEHTDMYLSFIMIIMFYFIFFFSLKILFLLLSGTYTHYLRNIFFCSTDFFLLPFTSAQNPLFGCFSLPFYISSFRCKHVLLLKKLFNFDLHSYSNHVNRRRQSFLSLFIGRLHCFTQFVLLIN